MPETGSDGPRTCPEMAVQRIPHITVYHETPTDQNVRPFELMSKNKNLNKCHIFHCQTVTEKGMFSGIKMPFSFIHFFLLYIPKRQIKQEAT
jgi:hypothetical protein